MYKYLTGLLIGTLSLTTYAQTTATKEAIERIATPKTISKEALTAKLIGTWQCTYDNDELSYHATLTFNKNGTFTSHKTSHTKDTPARTAVIHTVRDWAVHDNSGMWMLVEKVSDTTYFQVDDSLDNEAHLKAYLDSKPASESVMSFTTKDGKETLTRIDGAWGVLLGECTKQP